MGERGISDDELLLRLSAIYGEDFVAGVAQEFADARAADYTSESWMAVAIAATHKRFTYRMQDLAEFMKGLLQRFSQWFNRAHSRSGTLWEEVSCLYWHLMGLALGKKPGRTEASQTAKGFGQTTKNTAELLESKDNEMVLKDLGMSKMLRCRVRYFTDGCGELTLPFLKKGSVT